MTCEEGHSYLKLKIYVQKLFIFSLLASSAMGISLTDAVVSGDGSTALSWDDPAGEVTVVITLKVDQLKEYMLRDNPHDDHTLITLHASSHSGNYFSLITSSNTTNTQTIDYSGFYAQMNGGNKYSVGLNNDAEIGFEKESFWTDTSMAAVTFSYSAKNLGFTATFTLLDASGGIKQAISGTWPEGKDELGVPLTFNKVDFSVNDVTSAYVFPSESTLAQGDALFLASEAGRKELGLAVPEPTTATLSLLALASLAARRCRASR